MVKPLLILDLDETLVFATKTPLSHACDFEFEQYSVYKRPHLHQFLSSVSEVFDLAVWTSSTGDYAQMVVSEVFDGLKLEFLWARDRCTRRYDFEYQEHYWIKDLKKVKRAGYNLDRVLFVDNTPKKLERNYGNIVIVHDFEGDQGDQELAQLAEYLVGIGSERELRKIEKRGWRK